MSKQGVILVLYHAWGTFPLRDTIRSHLYCWKHYSKYRCIYINIAFGFPWWILQRVDIVYVVYHTTLLSLRWLPTLFEHRSALCRPLANITVPKIAIPQDEFLHTDLLGRFLADQQITHLYTCASENDWKNIYERHLDFSKVAVKTVLTGYLDEGTVMRIDAIKLQRRVRSCDIGYRAWRAASWLGQHGQHKVRAGSVICEAAKRRGFRVDCSLREEDVLVGDDWFKFLLNCRATVGAPGGASVLDRDGSVKASVEAYEHAHPEATFEEIRKECFPGRDGELDLACISPRHLEACLTETCQILIEGNYNGVLHPWRHYIPVQPDYRDVEAALEALADERIVDRIVKTAYEDIVASKRWTYESFVGEIERDVFGVSFEISRSSRLVSALFWARDWFHWRLVQLHAEVVRRKTKSQIIRLLYVWLKRVLTSR
mgnify:CR=1 FL=1